MIDLRNKGLELDRFKTLRKTAHISVWPTPIWRRPASFERAGTYLSNAAGPVQIDVDHVEMRTDLVHIRIALSNYISNRIVVISLLYCIGRFEH